MGVGVGVGVGLGSMVSAHGAQLVEISRGEIQYHRSPMLLRSVGEEARRLVRVRVRVRVRAQVRLRVWVSSGVSARKRVAGCRLQGAARLHER